MTAATGKPNRVAFLIMKFEATREVEHPDLHRLQLSILGGQGGPVSLGRVTSTGQ
jgi:hypothetical protein